jgi:hypothetical protein
MECLLDSCQLEYASILGQLCVWISPTLFETNVFKLLDGEFIQCEQLFEYVQNVIVLLSKSKA